MAMSLRTILCLTGSAALLWYGGRFCRKRGRPGPASRGRGPFKDAVKERLTDWRLRRSARGIVPLQNGLRDHAEGEFWFWECPRDAISRNVESIWNPRDGKCRDLFAGLPHSIGRPARAFGDRPGGREWLVNMTIEFAKNVQSVDKKLQGRILEAIIELIEDPTSARGDTVKQLRGRMRGLWRVRLGDYRLVYKPELERRLIVLLSFDSRGSAYEE